MLTTLWKKLGPNHALRRILHQHRQFDAERLLPVMVFNRCDPESRLGIMRWLEDTRVPDVSPQAVTH